MYIYIHIHTVQQWSEIYVCIYMYIYRYTQYIWIHIFHSQSFSTLFKLFVPTIRVMFGLISTHYIYIYVCIQTTFSVASRTSFIFCLQIPTCWYGLYFGIYIYIASIYIDVYIYIYTYELHMYIYIYTRLIRMWI
jgi:hypothetical protein